MRETDDAIDLREVAHHEAAHAVFQLKLGLEQGPVVIGRDAERGTLGHAQRLRPAGDH